MAETTAGTAADKTPEVALRLFGAPRIERAGTPVRVGHTKALALLAYLALTQKVQTRTALATFLWPRHDHSSGLGEVRRRRPFSKALACPTARRLTAGRWIRPRRCAMSWRECWNS